MAELLPNNFLDTSEQRIASYSFSELSSGLGFVQYYGSLTSEGSDNYNLSINTSYSHDIYTGSPINTTGSFVKIMDIDFDSSTFNLPRVITGQATSSIPLAVHSNDSETRQIYPKIIIKHYDGTTETTIGSASASGNDISISASDNVEQKVFNLLVDLPQTKFAEGDKIRITIEIYGKSTDNTGENEDFAFFHDPKNRSTTYESVSITNTQFSVNIPFEIDL